jgi:outer membrane protein TolC
MTIVFAAAATAGALEPADSFIIRDIEYQSFEKAAQLEIMTSEEIKYVVYELENPYRIIIDPLGPVWCDFEEAVYLGDEMVRSIKFIKGREIPNGPGQPYYPFDFVAIELNNPAEYRLSDKDRTITLNIGRDASQKLMAGMAKEMEEKVSVEIANEMAAEEAEPEAEKEKAREAEEKIAEDKRKPTGEKKRIETTKDRLKKERAKLKEEEGQLLEEKSEISSMQEEITKERREIDLARNELDKKRGTLEEERLRIAREKELLRLAEEKRKKERKTEEQMAGVGKMKAKAAAPRPIREIPEGPPPEYADKILSLEDCVNIAVANSLLVKTAKDRAELAKMRVNEAFRELFPELALFWDESRGTISDEHYRGRKFGMELKQVIFHGGEQIYLWEQSKVNLKIAKENVNKAKEEIIFEATKAYYELAKSLNKYRYQKALFDDANKDFEIAKKEREYELMSEIDFMNIDSAMTQIFHTMLSFKNNLSLSKLTLNKTMNIDNVNTDIQIDAELKFNEIDLDLGDCLSMALKFKPEYRVSYFNTEVAKLTEKLAKAKTAPQVDIFAKYSKSVERLEPVDILRKALENERTIGANVSIPFGPHTIDYQKKRTKLAPTVTTFESDTRSEHDIYRLSLFDDMARYSNIKDASASYKESLDEFNKAEQTIQTDVREAIFGFREAKMRIDGTRNNIELYDKELLVAQIKKGLNDISFYDLIEAKRKLYAEKKMHSQAVGDYYISLARVNKAIGLGGYYK